MTKKRDLKALVRERMEKTGETYMQAKAELQKTVFGSEPTHLLSEKKARLECIFCSGTFEGVAELKNHSTNCPEHPAVIEANRIRAFDRLTAAELKGRLTELEARQKAKGTVPGEKLVELRDFSGPMPADTAEWFELSRMIGRAEAREERAALAKIYSKRSPTEAMKSALAAWGVTIDSDGKMLGPDGTPMRAKWTREPAEEMAVFSKDAEVQVAATVMTEVFTALMGKDSPPPLNALELGAALRERERAFAAGRDPDNERNFFVWETEYKEDGCVEIYATSAEEAKAKYRKETGSEDSLDLTAVAVSSSANETAPAYRSVRSWAALKYERYKNRPEALEKIERLVDQDIAEMLGSEKKFRIGDIDFPIGSLTQAGRIKSITEDYYTKLPCGHFVLNPDSEAARQSAKELSEKFGIDAQAELKAMIDEELARHKSDKCLELPDWREVAMRSPTPEEQEEYKDPFLGAPAAMLRRKGPGPFQQAYVGLTDEELKERATLANPAELKKFIDGPPVPARAKYLSQEDEQKVAVVVSKMTSPQSPLPTNVVVKFPSTGPIEEVGYVDDETFTLVKMEKYPCGHSLRKNSETPADLRAMYGDAGVEAWNRILEQERQKHLNGKCDEAFKDLKLVPRFVLDKHIVVLVLMSDTGVQLYPPNPENFVEVPAEPVSVDDLSKKLVPIIVNGTPMKLQGPIALYQDVVRAADYDPDRVLTVTYHSKGGHTGGTLVHGQALELLPGMVFNVGDTSKT